MVTRVVYNDILYPGFHLKDFWHTCKNCLCCSCSFEAWGTQYEISEIQEPNPVCVNL